MRCTLRRKHCHAITRFRGKRNTFICAGIDEEPLTPGDFICFCIKSIDPDTKKAELLVDVSMRPDEAMESGIALTETVKDWLASHPAYDRISRNQSNTFTYRKGKDVPES